MTGIFKAPITAAQIKAKARELGADLVGIADGAAMNANPPDLADPRRPSDLTDLDGERVIVLARRLSAGVARVAGWGDRHKYYNDELALTMLEEASLELVYWLEDQGYPAIIVPPTHTDPWRYGGDPKAHQTTLLSLPHAAVEAGLGTLGLNLQLLTPEFGPRVILTAVLCSAPVEPDSPRTEALCQGPQCGRCLTVCPGDAVEQWSRDWNACDTYRSPYGFAKLTEHLGKIVDAQSPQEQKALLRSESSFNLWQSILRGSGVVTGCRRCADVCPVGADYPALLRDALEVIPEATPEKEAKRARFAAASDNGPHYAQQARWVGSFKGIPVRTQ
jgi:epoxyqueuosine reductase